MHWSGTHLSPVWVQVEAPADCGCVCVGHVLERKRCGCQLSARWECNSSDDALDSCSRQNGSRYIPWIVCTEWICGYLFAVHICRRFCRGFVERWTVDSPCTQTGWNAPSEYVMQISAADPYSRTWARIWVQISMRSCRAPLSHTVSERNAVCAWNYLLQATH